MSWSFSVGRIFGTDLRIHATFFLLLLWIAANAYSLGGVIAASQSLAFILALFACVVAHEFGHILMARRFGIKTPDITLLPIGGMARLERIPEDPKQEIAVALAGPAVNVVIWLVLMLLIGAEIQLDGLENVLDPSQNFWGRLAAVNLFLVVFNMIPAFPMDGGRVFRAVLALKLDRTRATKLAASTGQVLAFLFGFLGLSTGNPMLILIGVFVFFAATSENSQVAMHQVARNLFARDAMITSFETLSPNDSAQTAANTLIRTTQHEFPVCTVDGKVIGFLDRNAIFAAITHEGDTRRVETMLVPNTPTVNLTTPLQKVLDQLFQADTPAVAVIDKHGVMLGYITRENIGELMVVSAQKKNA